MATNQTGKRALIDKTNSTIVIVVSVAAALTAFAGVATKTLISQANYQNKVISAKRTAVDQLKADIEAVGTLKTSYDAFLSTSQNVIGGNPVGTGQQDGDNAKIVLDALPSFYDFPTLTTNLETLIGSVTAGGGSIKINSISGVDDEVAQSENTQSSNPEPIAIPFSVSVSGNYDAVKGVVDVFERSIRPIQILSFAVLGQDGSNLTLNIEAQTYYQPAKSLKIQSKVVE